MTSLLLSLLLGQSYCWVSPGNPDGGQPNRPTWTACNLTMPVVKPVSGPPLPKSLPVTPANASARFLPPCNAVRRTRCQAVPLGVNP